MNTEIENTNDWQVVNELNLEEQKSFKKAMQDIEYMEDPALHNKDALNTLFHASIKFPKPPSDTPFDIEGERVHNQNYGKVLNTEQEKNMFLRYNYARMMVVKYQDKFMENKTLENAKMLIKWYTTAIKIREYLVKMNLRIATQYAYKFMKNSILEPQELISEAQLYLIYAVNKYKVSTGYKFSTYASNTIIHAFGKIMRKKTQYHTMIPAHFQNDQDKDGESFDVPEREINITAQQIDTIREVIENNTANLEPLEMQVIKNMYFMDKVMTVEQIANTLNIGKHDVKKISVKAIEKLQKVIVEK